MATNSDHVVAFTFLNAERGMPFVYDGSWSEKEERTFHGRIQIGRYGYFFGMTPWDALVYASGPIIARVVVREPYEIRDGKGVSGRVMLWSAADASVPLRHFAFECALRAYLWASRTKWYPDVRLREVLDIVFDHIEGRADDDELVSAWRMADEIVAELAEKTMAKKPSERLDLAAAWAAAEAVRAAAGRAPWEAAWSAAWNASWAAGYAAAAKSGESEERRDATIRDAGEAETARLSEILKGSLEWILEPYVQ